MTAELLQSRCEGVCAPLLRRYIGDNRADPFATIAEAGDSFGKRPQSSLSNGMFSSSQIHSTFLTLNEFARPQIRNISFSVAVLTLRASHPG